MGLFSDWKQRRALATLKQQARSADWRVAEDAIARLPAELPPDEAIEILLPLSQGEGNAGIAIGGWSRGEERLSLAQEAATGRHIRSSIAALGRVTSDKATTRLLAVVEEMRGYANDALKALGSRRHASAAQFIERRAVGWPADLHHAATLAIWMMETDEALEAYLRLDKVLNPGSRAFSEETTRKAWLMAIDRRRQEEAKG